jgi:hypothetical protein
MKKKVCSRILVKENDEVAFTIKKYDKYVYETETV